MISDNNSLPHLDLISTLNSLNSFNDLSDIDPDQNIPVPSNFNYYTTQDFANDHQIINCTSSNCFSVLHSNIRSLNANFDNFTHMLNELNHTFSIIGLTDTKFQVSGEQLLNVNIPGYDFISQPSLSSYGGVGFFCFKQLKFNYKK